MFGQSIEVVRDNEVRKCEQIGGCNTKGVRLVHDQQNVGIDHVSEGPQERRVQIGVPHQKECGKPNRLAQGMVGGQEIYSSGWSGFQ